MWARLAISVTVCAAAATLCSCDVANAPSISMWGAQEKSATPGAHAGTQPVMASDPDLDAAVSMIADGQYAEAAKILERLAAGYESGNNAQYAAKALFWLGYCKEKMGNPAEASKYYRQVMERYPQTEAARLAQDRIDALSAPS